MKVKVKIGCDGAEIKLFYSDGESDANAIDTITNVLFAVCEIEFIERLVANIRREYELQKRIAK